MRVFFLPVSYAGEDFITLTDGDFHYICRVLRLGEGDSLTASDRSGWSYHVTLHRVERTSCILRVQKKGLPDFGLPAVTLYQCLPKGRKLDTIVRQATELGVSRIVPVESRYSVPKADDRDSRMDRLARIAREAAQQSGVTRVPEVSRVIRFPDVPGHWVKEGENPLGLFFHQAPLETTSLHEYLSIRRDSIAMVVGPEGGLADEEIEFLRSEGFFPAYLGPTVLRTETAPVYAVAAVHMIILEKKTWKPVL